jgi:hypothetical protein
MNLKETAEKFSPSKKKMITDVVIRQSNHMRNFTTYHSESLSIMFAEWHILFPHQLQDINCSSCRQAIVKFWEMMVDEWIELEQTPKKPNVSKKTKKKTK